MFKIRKVTYWSSTERDTQYTVCSVDRGECGTYFLIYKDKKWQWVDADYYELVEEQKGLSVDWCFMFEEY